MAINPFNLLCILQGKGDELLQELKQVTIKRIDAEFNVGYDRSKIAVDAAIEDVLNYLNEKGIL